MKDTAKVLMATLVAVLSQVSDWLSKQSSALTGLAALLACAYTTRKFWVSFQKKREKRKH